MKKTLLLIAYLFAVAMPLAAQPQAPQSVSRNLTAAGTACGATNCLLFILPGNSGAASIQLKGTFAGTLEFEATSDGATWVAINGTDIADSSSDAETTAAGIWQFSTAGLSQIRARVSAYTSGTFEVFMLSGTAPPGASSSATIEGEVMVEITGFSTEDKQDDQITLLAGGLPAALGAGGGIKVDGSGTALPISGTVTANLSATDNAVLDDIADGIAVTGTVTANLSATDNAVLDDIADGIPVTNAGTFATQIVVGGITASTRDTGSNDSLNVAIVDGSGNQITSIGGGTQYTEADTDATITGNVMMAESLTSANRIDALTTSTAGSTRPLDIIIRDTSGNALTTFGTGGTAAADDADFTAGTTNFTPVGGFYQSVVTACTDGDICAFAITANRALVVSTGISDAAAGATVTSAPVPVGCVKDGTPTQADADQDVGYVRCDADGQPMVVIASSALPTGAATAANQTTLITAAQLIDDPVFVDEAAFTYATSKGFTMMAVAEATVDAIADGLAGVPSMTLNRVMRNTPTGYLGGGGVPVNMLSDNTDNDDETAICTGPCTVYSIAAFNHTAASVFLRCENDTAGNTTPGSETNADGEFDLEIPSGTTQAGGFVYQPGGGIGASFATALTCWLATGEASSSTVDPAQDDVRVQFVRVQ